ncbi:MAG: hypothetical protein MUF72_23815 [Elainella sp. Prado103]|nr:hypothetical protein [Elainella sp. Prado103]
MSDAQIQLRIQLRIQQHIRDYEDQLVKKIEDAFKKDYGALDPSQYQNLVQVALSTESSEVIKNFLRYQVGRETKWGRGSGSLAEAIILDIQGDLEKQADEIVNAIKNEIQEEVKKLSEGIEKSDDLEEKIRTLSDVIDGLSKRKRDVHIELIRRYLGYGKRHLIFLKPKK